MPPSTLNYAPHSLDIRDGKGPVDGLRLRPSNHSLTALSYGVETRNLKVSTRGSPFAYSGKQSKFAQIFKIKLKLKCPNL